MRVEATTSNRGGRRRLTALAGAVLLVLSACTASPGGTTGPSDGGEPKPTPVAGQCVNTTTPPAAAADPIAAAQERAMISYNAPSEWNGPTSAPKPTPGKKVAIVSVAQLTEGSNRAARGMEAAAKAMGWEPTILDGKGQPDVILNAVNSAVDSGYDGIMMIFVDPDTVSEPLNRAKAAGIPVVTLGQSPYTQTRTEVWGHIPDTSHDWVYTGEVIADYMIWKSEGKANALLLNGAETTIVNCGQFKGTFDRLLTQDACPECTAIVDTFTIAQLETTPGQKAVAAIQANPDLGWIWCYDFCMARSTEAIVAAGLADRVKGAGFDCNAENIELIKEGKVQTVCIADPRDWEAWAATDNLNRLIEGQDAVDQRIPVRLFDVDNIDEFTDDDIANGWQGGFDYKAEYRRLWAAG